MRILPIFSLAVMLLAEVIAETHDGSPPLRFKAIDCRDGRTFKDVRITELYPDRMHLRHAQGSAWLLLAELTDPFRIMFSYDEAKAEDYTEKRIKKWPSGQPSESDIVKLALKELKRAYPKASTKEDDLTTFRRENPEGYGTYLWRVATPTMFIPEFGGRRGTVVISFDYDGNFLGIGSHGP